MKYSVVFILFLIGCGPQDNTGPDGKIDGKKVFTNNCVSCHGDDGKAGIAGATDLSSSGLSKTEKNNVVTNGRAAMMPYKDVLSKEEIAAVVDYLETLKD